MYKYRVSVIMAVYNVEPFLRDAVDSVIHQSIGFQNIQLILVDDGSPDGSGTICDEYAERYPDNIVVIHKENGGVSSARNTGVKFAEGKYLNFMDADDTLSENACLDVFRYFEKHYEETDVVAFPMYFFEGATGPHILNNKFDRGDRIIDLQKEYQYIQLSTASSFLKKETFTQMELQYDTKLKFTEDAKLLAQLLSEKQRLGVVSTCRYNVRRRNFGSMSATQSSVSRKEWWLDTLKYFQLETIDTFRETLGEVPKFVQYLMMYDLQWRLQRPEIPKNLLTDREIQEYDNTLRTVLRHIDDEVIWSQEYIGNERKTYALRKKYGEYTKDMGSKRERAWHFLSAHGLELTFLELNKDSCTIDGRVLTMLSSMEKITIEAVINHTHRITATPIAAPKYSAILGEETSNSMAFRVRLPLDVRIKTVHLAFFACIGGTTVKLDIDRMERYFPITKELNRSYFCKDHWKLRAEKDQIVICRCGWLEHIKSELMFIHQLYHTKPIGGQKAIVARLLTYFLRIFKRKPLILLSDRIMRGGDNGEALFRYIQKHCRHQVNAVFIISKDCEDYSRMRKIGRVVSSRSHLHSLLHLLCDVNASSSAEIQTFYPFAGYDAGYKDLVHHVKSVFLQHGITKDDISGWINRYEKNLHGVVAAANAEYDAFLTPQYCYHPENIWLTGFPRFDRLYHDECNCIAIVPTWRKQLMGELDANTGKWPVSPSFYESDFLRFYNSLLGHPRLHEALRKYNYKLQFLPHPNMTELADKICEHPDVQILGNETQYRELYAKCKLIVTDYSSVVFDFAYLRKPVLYTHFDADEFFGGAHSYDRGYFDYERDGFGEVEYTLEDTVDRIIEYLESDCQLKEKYRDRIDNFFAFNDQNNCQRVYDRIMEL